MSRSLLNFFRDNNLNNEIIFHYNEITLLGGKKDKAPIFEKNNRYHYYIPLKTPINGYNRIVVSPNAESYIDKNKYNLNLERLRIDFFPWPEIVLASEKYLKNGYHEERDSIDDVYTRFDFIGDRIYDKLKPQYNEIIYKGIKAITEYNIEYPLNLRDKMKRDNRNYNYDEEDDNWYEDKSTGDIRDAYESGEYLPEDW